MKRRPTHPGEILREEFLKPLRLSKSVLAKEIHVSPHVLHDLLSCKKGVTPALALKLAHYFGTSPELWLHLQNRYDLYCAMKKTKKELRQIKRCEQITVA